MKIICSPDIAHFKLDSANFILYSVYKEKNKYGSLGKNIFNKIRSNHYSVLPKAWDFLSIALSALAADYYVKREDKADGWTRELNVTVAVSDRDFWKTQKNDLEKALRFLTTDIWNFDFVDNGSVPPIPKTPFFPENDCVSLLSGGLDSLIGLIDLKFSGKSPLCVSQTVRGDREKQLKFAKEVAGVELLQLSHTIHLPNGMQMEPSQRVRSIIFLAYGIVAGTSLFDYHDGKHISLYICENGFISLNPPFTQDRIGSLSTRTAHPEFLSRIQKIITAAGIQIMIKNPYQFKTKGEMLVECQNQEILKKYASISTSCGRFLRHGHTHCGRCIPCQIRRAAFLKWKNSDTTRYKYNNLGKDDDKFSGFDDVRSISMALNYIDKASIDKWLSSSLSYTSLNENYIGYKQLIERSIEELKALHDFYKVK